MDLLQVLEGLAYVGFIAGAVFAIYELRGMKKDRWIGLMLQIADHGATPEFENALTKIFRSTASDAKGLEEQVSYRDMSMVSDYFEAIAFLVNKGHIEKRPILEFIPFDDVWKRIAPWVIAIRKEHNSPGTYEDFENLAELQSKM